MVSVVIGSELEPDTGESTRCETKSDYLTHNAIGHEVMPVQLPAAVVLLVEIFHLRDQVLQLRGQRHKHFLAAPRPCAGVQDLYVDRVRCKEADSRASGFSEYWSSLWLESH